MKTCKEDMDLLYEVLGRICLSSCFMEVEDQERVAELIEEVIKIIKSYEE